MSSIVKILLPLRGLPAFDYRLGADMDLQVGDLAEVPYRQKTAIGVVFEKNIKTNLPHQKIRQVLGKFPASIKINPALMELIKFTARYYIAPAGSICKMALPLPADEMQKLLRDEPHALPAFAPNLAKLSDEQTKMLEQINISKKPVLLRGVTGSGKTEIYYHLMQQHLSRGNQVLLMLPEIGLSHQIIDRTRARFGGHIEIWNSSVTPAKKRSAFKNITSGAARIIIGTRSSLFLPYKNLSLVIIDEEHDASYKQESSPNYNARDMAVMLSKLSGVKLVLGSATPSAESYYNASRGLYDIARLAARHAARPMPELHMIDMRTAPPEKGRWISPPLEKEMRACISRGRQVMLFLNRRGYAPLALCKACGYKFNCPNCSSSLVVHKQDSRLQCHHCGYATRAPSDCPNCGEKDSIIPCGPGVERIAQEAAELLPGARIAVLSKDSKEGEKILERIEKNEIDIIIGTQMISKGYHFAHLELVGVIDADLGLAGSELRAAERCFQLLHQVGGRAGRAGRGMVMMQSFQPSHPLFKTLISGRADEFMAYELESRKRCFMPPFARAASITISSKNEARAAAFAKKLVAAAPALPQAGALLGPAPAVMARLAGQYRYKILIITPRGFDLQNYLQAWQGALKTPASCTLKIDIDPQSFY